MGGFRQAVLLYEVPSDDNGFDIDKDVYKGQLVLTKNMAGKGDEGEVFEGEEEEGNGTEEGTPKVEEEEADEAEEEEVSGKDGSGGAE